MCKDIEFEKASTDIMEKATEIIANADPITRPVMELLSTTLSAMMRNQGKIYDNTLEAKNTANATQETVARLNVKVAGLVDTDTEIGKTLDNHGERIVKLEKVVPANWLERHWKLVGGVVLGALLGGMALLVVYKITMAEIERDRPHTTLENTVNQYINGKK